MAAALPGNIRLKLEQTLAQWRQWDCDPALACAPIVQGVLTGGLSNFNVLVAATQRPQKHGPAQHALPEKRFVVRLDGVNPAAHKLNRQGEWRSLVDAHDAGLAPRPRYFNPELGSLVCDYLPPDESPSVSMPDIAALFRGIHHLPSRHHRLDLAERILSYEKRLEHRDPARAALVTRYKQATNQALAFALSHVQPQVLCHNDLLRSNRIYSGGRLFALDWEYCAMGSPWYDLAVVVAGDALEDGAINTLLHAYLRRPATTAEQHLVQQYSCVYRYLELLWYLAQDHPGLDDARLQQSLGLLEENLSRAQAMIS